MRRPYPGGAEEDIAIRHLHEQACKRADGNLVPVRVQIEQLNLRGNGGRDPGVGDGIKFGRFIVHRRSVLIGLVECELEVVPPKLAVHHDRLQFVRACRFITDDAVHFRVGQVGQRGAVVLGRHIADPHPVGPVQISKYRMHFSSSAAIWMENPDLAASRHLFFWT